MKLFVGCFQAAFLEVHQGSNEDPGASLLVR
jgi:hypothetical protein